MTIERSMNDLSANPYNWRNLEAVVIAMNDAKWRLASDFRHQGFATFDEDGIAERAACIEEALNAALRRSKCAVMFGGCAYVADAEGRVLRIPIKIAADVPWEGEEPTT